MVIRSFDFAEQHFSGGPFGLSTCEQVRGRLRSACQKNGDIAEFHHLGVSEEGRPIDAVVLGTGKTAVSLLAGAHSDEPVGAETLRWLILSCLAHRQSLLPFLQRCRLVVIPHINPDGEARNQRWMRCWPDAAAYLQHVFREPPGRDLEFGFPDMRVENRLVSRFLARYAPFTLHVSLHGMAFSEGAMLLVERHWVEHTAGLRRRFAQLAARYGLPLHDHDRQGEKGFLYIAPGFSTTPEGERMQAYFREKGDEDTASRFHLSSMEYLRRLGGNPLCLVTELPLFLVERKTTPRRPGMPLDYLRFRNRIPQLQEKLARGKSIAVDLRQAGVQPLPLRRAMQIQAQVIALGIAAAR